MIKKYILLTLFFVSVLLIIPNFSFGATNVEMQIQSLMAQIQALQKQLSELQVQQSSDKAWCHTFNTNLKIGDSNKEVTALHQALFKEGLAGSDLDGGTGAGVGDEYGEETASAVTGFQEKYRDEVLTPVGLKYGTGYVGKSTRAKLNQLYGCGTTKPPSSAGYLEIEPSSASLAVGGSVSMQAIFQPPMPKCPEGFACPKVMPARYPVVAEWTSSNPKVASVDVIGSCAAIGCPTPATVLIKGVSSGTADIKAAYKSSSGTFLAATAKVVVSGGTSTNNPPVINGIPAIPSVTKVNQSVLFSWSATDANGDNLSWSVSWGDGTGMAGACESLNQQNKQGWNFAASHTWSNPGTYTVKAIANDCRGGSNEHTFNVTVGSVSITPSITVLSPNGGEVLARGNTYTITWKNLQNIGSLDIFLVKGGKILGDIGFVAATAISNAVPTSFVWKVGSESFMNYSDGNDYKIRISDQKGGIFDESDAPFSIVAGTSSTNGEININQFGAKGDGIADDTTAVQNAFNAPGATTISCSNGTFLVGEITVPAGIKTVKGQCTFKMRPASVPVGIFRVPRTNGLTIDGITFQGVGGANKIAAENGIYILGGGPVLVQNVTCTMLRAFCVELDHVTDAVIKNNIVRNNADAFFFNQVTRGSIIGNTVTDTSYIGPTPSAIQVGGEAFGSSVPTYSQDITIANNSVKNWIYECIFVYSGKRITITNNHCENTQSGIQLTPEAPTDVITDITISGNTTIGLSAGPTTVTPISGYGILVAQQLSGGPAQNIMITGNTVRNANAWYRHPTEAGGIVFQSVKNITVERNTVTDSYGNGIMVGGGGNTGISNFKVANNTINSIPAINGHSVGIYNPITGSGAQGQIIDNKISNAATGLKFETSHPSIVVERNVLSAGFTPLITGAIISNSSVTANGSAQYTITVSASDPDGGEDIGTLYAIINHQGQNAGIYRGFIGWSTSGFPEFGSFKSSPVACSGGGQSGINAGYGASFINLISCSTSVSGNTRTVSYTVTFNPGFISPKTGNTISGWTQDSGGHRDTTSNADGWKQFGTFSLALIN